MSLDPQQTAQLRAPVGPKASFDAAKVRGLHGYDETSDCPTICPGDGLDYKRSLVHPSDVPAASSLSGSETITALQGSGLVRTTLQAIADLVASGLYQPLDEDLTAIAALSTQAFGRSLLTATDAAAARASVEALRAPVRSQGWAVSSAVPHTLAIGTNRRIDVWFYNSSGGSADLTITPNGGGALTITLQAWLNHVEIVFDSLNFLGAQVNGAVSRVASGTSTEIVFSTTMDPGWAHTATRCEIFE